MKHKKAKIGDIIEYTCPIDSDNIFSGRTFRVEVMVVNKHCYGVYAEYGFDLVPFEQAKIINK